MAKDINNWFYRISMGAIFAQTYSINLLWVNKEINTEMPYIFPEIRIVQSESGRTTQTHRHLENIEHWAQYHPKQTITLWYDSQYVTPEQIAHTQALFEDLSNRYNTTLKIADVNSLDMFKIFEDKTRDRAGKIKVYFKVDLYKLFITHAGLKRNPKQLFVYSDLDLKPLPAEELFDDMTMQTLDKVSFLFADKGNLGFENSFHMFRYDEDMIDALEIAMMASIALANNDHVPSPQLVYDRIPKDLLIPFYWKKGLVKLESDQEEVRVFYDHIKESRPKDLSHLYDIFTQKIVRFNPSRSSELNNIQFFPDFRKAKEYVTLFTIETELKNVLNLLTKRTEGKYYSIPLKYALFLPEETKSLSLYFCVKEDLTEEEQAQISEKNTIQMFDAGLGRKREMKVISSTDKVQLKPSSSVIFVPGKDIDHAPLFNYD